MDNPGAYSVFYEITAIISVAALVGLIGTLLRQPLVVSFIAVGILVGPVGLNLVTDYEQVELLASIGIALLLFVVGLRLDLHAVRTLGTVVLGAGVTQIAFIAIAGFFLARLLGFAAVPSLVIAIALVSSSTIIIVKLLSDKREIDALHGRLTVAISVLQDLMVILAMIGLSALAGAKGADNHLVTQMLLTAGRGVLFLAGVGVMMTVVLPRLLPHMARSTELLLLFAVAWALALAALAEVIGLSKEVGAFVAGLALGWSPYRETISARMVPLRDFLLLFFFIDLGLRLDLRLLGGQIGIGLLFALFLLAGKALTVMAVVGLMGYRKRTGFLTGIAMTPLSEFGLIFVGMALGQGHIGDEIVGLITVIALISIGMSTYMIIYSGQLYSRLSRLLTVFERRVPYREAGSGSVESLPQADVILFGLGTYGGAVAKHLLEHGRQVVGVDFDPQVLAAPPKEGLARVYGDGEDPELFDYLPLQRARWVMSALPGRDTNLTLLKAVRERGFDAKVVLSARSQYDARVLEQAGADLVLCPFADAAEQAADSLTEAMETLTREAPWPVDAREVRLRPGSAFAGQTIEELPLRAETGVSIIAISRAGRSYFDPGPDFRLDAGDRLVLLGEPENLERAVEYLERRQLSEPVQESQQFTVSELQVPEGSPWVSKTLAELNLRRTIGVTVIGIERGEQQITAPTAAEVIQAGDRVVLAGSRSAMETCEGACQPPR
ncbi:MAG: sodium:proton exchanger [candidate division WS1 bacterium]|nr:sodium:proton exchanger [candidate division WS1 bacterium]